MFSWLNNPLNFNMTMLLAYLEEVANSLIAVHQIMAAMAAGIAGIGDILKLEYWSYFKDHIVAFFVSLKQYDRFLKIVKTSKIL